MLFNSVSFALFLPIAFGLYWLVGAQRRRAQNLLILVASYVFYGWWDWRFLSLIVISSLVDFVVGGRLPDESSPRRRKLLLLASLAVNLGFLGFFKYCDFFIDSFADLISRFGLQPNLPSLRVILPVGISFYTFQTLSYTIDIYRRKIQPTRDALAFFTFVAFFPQLVAGPIERAKSLLPQFLARRVFEPQSAREGLRLMLWGLFKKVVIADNLAGSVNMIFADPLTREGPELVLGVFFFAIQIYGDFSGYSDIARGTARLFGFQLMRNFAFPYFSRDIAEFWHRWHISLSSWFRDYLFIPLGGSRAGPGRRLFNILVTFTVSGFWHGANWTFIVWGLLNGLYYVPVMLAGSQKQHTDIVAAGRLIPGLLDALKILITFGLTLVAWVFFRSASLSQAFAYLARIVEHPLPGNAYYDQYSLHLFYGISLLVVEWVQRNGSHGLDVGHLPVGVRWLLYMIVLTAVFTLGDFGGSEFIYFQF